MMKEYLYEYFLMICLGLIWGCIIGVAFNSLLIGILTGIVFIIGAISIFNYLETGKIIPK